MKIINTAILLTLTVTSAVAKGPVRGRVVNIFIDSEKGPSEVHTGLEEPKGRSIRLLGKTPPAGAYVEVTPRTESENVMAVGKFRVLPDLAEISEPKSPRLLAVRVAFSNGTQTPCSATQLSELLFTGFQSTKDLYREISRGAFELQGQVHDQLVTIDPSPSFCDYPVLGQRIDDALVRQGVALDSFDKLMYFLPSVTCGWSGIAFGYRRSFINSTSCTSKYVVAHELGHNLGLHHAQTPGAEYGDNSDFMGSGFVYVPGLNAVNKDRLDWIYPDEVKRITLKDEGTHSLAPSNSPYLGPQIRALAVSDPDLEHQLYASFRQPLGFDAGLHADFFSKLSVHRGTDTFDQVTTLLGLVPLGGSHLDTASGVRVSFLGMNAGVATVKVTKECVRLPPTLEVVGEVKMQRSAQREVEVRFRNNNRPLCADASYQLSFTGPAGVAGELIQPTSPTPSGAEASAVLRLTSSVTDFTPLTYSVSLSGSDGSTAQKPLLVTFDETPPPAPYDLVVEPNHACRYVDTSWSTVRNADTARFEVYKTGGVSVITDEPSYRFERLRMGIHGFRVRSLDEAGNASEYAPERRIYLRSGSSPTCPR